MDSLAMLGVGAIFQPRQPCRPGPRWEQALDTPDECLYRSTLPARRYEVVEGVLIVDTAAALEAALRDPADGKTIPVLAPSGAVPDTGAGTVVVREHSEGRATLSTVAAKPSLVLVRETWKPGWHATVDGTPAPIYRAAGVFFVVPVPAGAHTLVVRFQQPGLVPGLAAGAAGVALAAIALVRKPRDHALARRDSPLTVEARDT